MRSAGAAAAIALLPDGNARRERPEHLRLELKDCDVDVLWAGFDQAEWWRLTPADLIKPLLLDCLTVVPSSMA